MGQFWIFSQDSRFCFKPFPSKAKPTANGEAAIVITKACTYEEIKDTLGQKHIKD